LVDDVRPKLLLVVEDDDDLRSVLAGILAVSGYHVEAARDGAVAWQRMQHEPQPSAVLLDLSMPRVDGQTLRRRMLESEHTKSIPVIVCTGSSQTPVVPEATILKKPVDIEELLSAIKAALG
jgi:twitching motility two-component system response regulator PilH